MLIRTILITSAIASVAVASAQSTPLSGFGFTAGVFFPSNTTVKNAYSNTGFSLGVDYALGKPYMLGRSTATPSLELSWTKNGGSDNLSTWGLLATSRVSLGESTGTVAGFAPYALLGFGAFRHQAELLGTSETKTTLGGYLGIGADVTKNVSIEAAYRFSGKVNGSSTDGFFARARFRF